MKNMSKNKIDDNETYGAEGGFPNLPKWVVFHKEEEPVKLFAFCVATATFMFITMWALLKFT